MDENAKKKLSEKNCDWIIANDVSNEEIGFNSDFNQVKIFYKNNSDESIGKMSKSLIAEEIVDRVIKNFN